MIIKKFILLLIISTTLLSQIENKSKREVIKSLLELNDGSIGILNSKMHFWKTNENFFVRRKSIPLYKNLWNMRENPKTISRIFNRVKYLKLVKKHLLEQRNVLIEQQNINIIVNTLSQKKISYIEFRKAIANLLFYYPESDTTVATLNKILLTIDIENILFSREFHFFVSQLVKIPRYKIMLLSFLQSKKIKYSSKKIIIACFLSYKNNFFARQFLDNLFLSREGKNWIFYYQEQISALPNRDMLYYAMITYVQNNEDNNLKIYLKNRIEYLTCYKLKKILFNLINSDIQTINYWYAKNKKFLIYDNLLGLWTFEQKCR